MITVLFVCVNTLAFNAQLLSRRFSLYPHVCAIAFFWEGWFQGSAFINNIIFFSPLLICSGVYLISFQVQTNCCNCLYICLSYATFFPHKSQTYVWQCERQKKNVSVLWCLLLQIFKVYTKQPLKVLIYTGCVNQAKRMTLMEFNQNKFFTANAKSYSPSKKRKQSCQKDLNFKFFLN